MSWWKIVPLTLQIIGVAVGYYCIRSSLRRFGYKRYVAQKKPHLNERAQRARLQFAHDHVNWTIDDWSHILWTDETWVTGGPHRKQYVTRRADEIYNADCLVEKWQRKKGWMFWGSFSGRGKGPSISWEKEWGTITTETFCERIVPLIDGWVQLCASPHIIANHESLIAENLMLMQDNAPLHASCDTRQELEERGVITMAWPAHSPDLNPIETVWCKMKDYIEDQYGHIENPLCDQLRTYVIEAWDSIEDDYLRELLATMPQCCRDVIAAEGGATKW